MGKDQIARQRSGFDCFSTARRSSATQRPPSPLRRGDACFAFRRPWTRGKSTMEAAARLARLDATRERSTVLPYRLIGIGRLCVRPRFGRLAQAGCTMHEKRNSSKAAKTVLRSAIVASLKAGPPPLWGKSGLRCFGDLCPFVQPRPASGGRRGQLPSPSHHDATGPPSHRA